MSASSASWSSPRSYQLETNPKPLQVADTLTHCELLETLVLANNRLTWLPKDFGSLSRIKLLDLRCNSLESVPESIVHIATLEILDLRINELKELPVNIGNCSVCASPPRPYNRTRTWPTPCVCQHLSARSVPLGFRATG